MNPSKIDFDALVWEEPAAGVRCKAVSRAGRRLRLVEFTSEFVEEGWCVLGHVGYVLAGEVEIAFAGRTEVYKAGDGIFIEGGEAERHRARVFGETARLLLVEDV
ncbi:MAG TPA: cupin domain-containing protein [Pyrinomonadaceae bacterium]|jgi:hypothetical protein|nr:cupin domain-containing protein [Pyrinomonadaceae bacterium]